MSNCLKLHHLATILICSTTLFACSSNIDSSSRSIAEARTQVALAYLENGDYAGAKMSLDKAISYDKEFYFPYLVFARYYQLLGENDKAEQNYQLALRKDSQQGSIHNNYGAFLCQQGNYKQAQQQFNQALSIDSYHQQTETYQNITLCAYQENNQPLFQQGLEKLQRLSTIKAEQLEKTLGSSIK